MNVSRSPLWSSKASKIESYCFYAFLSKFMGKMSPIANVGIQPMEHNNDGLWFSYCWIAIGLQLNRLFFFIYNFKVNEVHLWKKMFSLRVGSFLLLYSGIFDSLLSLRFWELKKVLIFLEFAVLKFHAE